MKAELIWPNMWLYVDGIFTQPYMFVEYASESKTVWVVPELGYTPGVFSEPCDPMDRDGAQDDGTDSDKNGVGR